VGTDYDTAAFRGVHHHLLVAGRNQAAYHAAHHRRWWRVQRLPQPAVEDRAGCPTGIKIHGNQIKPAKPPDRTPALAPLPRRMELHPARQTRHTRLKLS
jgi:hypothetical protein